MKPSYLARISTIFSEGHEAWKTTVLINLQYKKFNITEDYRSGHNEAVLKTVCLYGHEGSNPPSSAKTKKHSRKWVLFLFFIKWYLGIQTEWKNNTVKYFCADKLGFIGELALTLRYVLSTFFKSGARAAWAHHGIFFLQSFFFCAYGFKRKSV